MIEAYKKKKTKEKRPCESSFWKRIFGITKSSLSATLHPPTDTHAKFQLSTASSFGCCLSVSQSLSNGKVLYILILHSAALVVAWIGGNRALRPFTEF